jgi:hypothetical protein
MSDEIKAFLHLIDEGFDKPAWHGPNLMGAIRNGTPKEMLHRPRKNAHNAWELLVHCAYWKRVIRMRLLGERTAGFPLPGSNFFSRERGLSEKDLKEDVRILKQAHADLRSTVVALDPKSYDGKAKGSRHGVRRTVLGIAAHDIYHAGQIRLLRKLASAR